MENCARVDMESCNATQSGIFSPLHLPAESSEKQVIRLARGALSVVILLK